MFIIGTSLISTDLYYFCDAYEQCVKLKHSTTSTVNVFSIFSSYNVILLVCTQCCV